MNADALILMSLLGDHDVGLVEDEAFNFGRVDASVLDQPVEHFARGADDNLLLDLLTSLD